MDEERCQITSKYKEHKAMHGYETQGQLPSVQCSILCRFTIILNYLLINVTMN